MLLIDKGTDFAVAFDISLLLKLLVPTLTPTIDEANLKLLKGTTTRNLESSKK